VQALVIAAVLRRKIRLFSAICPSSLLLSLFAENFRAGDWFGATAASATHSGQLANVRSPEKSPGIPGLCAGYLHAETENPAFSTISAR
jgi:hypothetical protein